MGCYGGENDPFSADENPLEVEDGKDSASIYLFY